MAGRERKLTTIVAIDVAGYSRLMHDDETGTLDGLNQVRATLDTLALTHSGRLFGSAGDGFLLEFPSVVEAVGFALRAQTRNQEHQAGSSEDRRLLLRMGINIGDVLVEDEQLFGDGVNIASRLEGLAEPGGICLSRAARDQVRDRLDLEFDDLGDVEVKNIARPVRAFHVRAAPDVIADLAPRAPGHVVTPPRRLPVRVLLAVALLIFAAAAIGFWWTERPDFEPPDPSKFAFALPEKPSIVVLPFEDLSREKGQAYLANGLTENITSVLAATPDIFVISRAATPSAKGTTAEIREAAERYGVRYVLTGSVQREEDRLRVSVQLADTQNRRHLWAERYDRELRDLMVLQDEIADKVLTAMQVRLSLGKSAATWREQVGTLDNYLLFLRCREEFQKFSKQGHADAKASCGELYSRLPDVAIANDMMAYLLWQRVQFGLSSDARGDMAKSREFAERALSLGGDRRPATLVLLAQLDVYTGKHDSAIAHIDRALELAPNHSTAYTVGGFVKHASGQAAEGAALLRFGMRIQPVYPTFVPRNLSFALLEMGDYAQAMDVAKGVLPRVADNPRNKAIVLRLLAAAAVLAGDEDAGRRHMDEMRRIDPKLTVQGQRKRAYFMKNQDFVERYVGALRRAGLPEAPEVEK